MAELASKRLEEAFKLWLLTGWNDGYRLSEQEFVHSWRSSPVTKGIVEDGELVAIGRANSDGVVYGMIYDVVVHPDHRGRGLGTKIVLELRQELESMGVRVVQLMSAVGQAPFYEKLGFDPRPPDGPGMQWLRKIDEET